MNLAVATMSIALYKFSLELGGDVAIETCRLHSVIADSVHGLKQLLAN